MHYITFTVSIKKNTDSGGMVDDCILQCAMKKAYVLRFIKVCSMEQIIHSKFV